MEVTVAILMVLGIFVGIPAVIGFAVAGIYIMSGRRARRVERVQALGETATEAHGEAVAAKLAAAK